MLLRPPISTLFPYTTLFRSDQRLTVRVPFRHAVKRRIELHASAERARIGPEAERLVVHVVHRACQEHVELSLKLVRDRKSTRLNSSHANISYAVFCLKKKKI